MENLYSYVLWYNPHNKTWYGIPRDRYTEFFADSKNNKGIIKASTVAALVTTINKL
jgi:hypothetical protein